MSWRTGAELFREVWPVIQAHIRDKRQRREFTAGLLRLLVEHDVDPADVADVHPEVRAATDAAREIMVRLEALPFLARLDEAMARSAAAGRPIDAHA